MPNVQSVAVFCGAQSGADPACRQAALAFGAALAASGMRLIYGGGRVGLMGAVADGALAAGGVVIGVIPDFLMRLEVAHDGVAEMIVTDSMHTRKRRMFDLADAFVTLPGGIGTFDETIEAITWRQLKLHDKPILIVDVGGSAAALVAMITSAVAAGFARTGLLDMFEVIDGVDAAIERLRQITPAPGGESARL